MRRTRLRPRELTALWLLSTVLATPSAARRSETAASCQYPPSLNTLRQSTKDTSDAEVVYTNCSVVKLVSSASNGTTSLDASNLNIQSVSSFPDVTTVVLSGNAITTIEDDPDATVKTLDLSSNGLSGLYDLSIPSSVNRLVLDGNAIAALDDGELASSVTTLSLKKNGITSLSSFEFSESLVGLDASENTLYDLSKWQMPSQLQVFTCRECEVSSLSGISFPSSGSLTTFDLTGSTVESFEIANSTVALLENLGWLQLTVSSTTCSEPSAKKNDFQSATVCVLPDALFNSKYVIDSSETSETAPTPPPPVPVNGSAPVVTIPPPVETASASWMMVAMISGAALMLMLIGGAVGYLVFRHRRTNKYDEYTEDGRSPSFHAVDIIGADAPGNNRTTHISTPSLHTATLQSGALRSATQDTEESSVRRSTRPALSGKHLDNDIRTDQEMRHFRLMHEEVVRGKLIAKGGYGAVYMASFRNKVVVMKQLLPERARDYRMLNNFMDEIRVCASLDHPKIVSFIGFTFSSLMDLSAVMEYMPRGDLSTVMQKQLKRENRDPLARDSYGWFRSTRSDRGGLKCKSLIALDIAEALVYLHSFENPMIHRDLKPNNVLLSESWEAKLTDFGTSRELIEDQTMTAEIGTVAWIAPEVLRGERYSEKADVYSFGVIMTELDTCRRPYSEGIPSDESRVGNNKHTNTRIAVLVSAGALRPSLSRDCPPSVRKLAEKCLDSDPTKRPSAIQLHFELRNLDLPIEELEASGRLASRRMSAVPRRGNHRPSRRMQSRPKQSEPHIQIPVGISERGTRTTDRRDRQW